MGFHGRSKKKDQGKGMIIFNGTKKVGHQSYLLFGNTKEIIIEVPVSSSELEKFLLYFDRLEPTKMPVETGDEP
jgi:hypothetical protein